MTTSSNDMDFETTDQQLPPENSNFNNKPTEMEQNDIYDNPDNEYIGLNDWPKTEETENLQATKKSEKLLNKTRIFYGSSPMYLLLRYHNVLCQRLLYIYRYSEKQIFKQQDSAVKRAKAAMSSDYNQITTRLQGSEAVADVLSLRRKLDIDVRDYYVAFIDQVKKLLDSNIDQDQYEDNLRDMFSTRAYHMFTINKIIVHAVKHLQQVCQDSQKLLECHKAFRRDLSGEMRSTPNVTTEILNNVELMDSTKEQ